MQFCLGVLGWPPAAFWAATTPEVAAAIEGWSQLHGVSTKSRETPSVDFMAEMLARFPDETPSADIAAVQ